MVFKSHACVLCLSIVISIPATTRAEINLEWRPATQNVQLGETVDIGLYAVADGPDESIGAMEVIFTWNPASLQFQELDDTGGPTWLSSGLPTILDYGLNESIPPQDGDGLYRAQAQLGSAIYPGTSGMLITTFRFMSVGATSLTVLDIPPTGGDGGRTIVYDGILPNTNVTGQLGSASVTVIGPPPGDMDGDGDVDLDDYAKFADCLNGPNNPNPPPGCTQAEFLDADVNDDIDVDLHDFAIFADNFTG